MEKSGAGTACHFIATVGFSNALATGDPAGPLQRSEGTINILRALSRPLTEEAALEAMALVAGSVGSGRDASGGHP